MNRTEEQVIEKVSKLWDHSRLLDSRWFHRISEKIGERAEQGQLKYGGMTLESNDLSRLDWLLHAEDKILDAITYLEKVIDISETDNWLLTYSQGKLTETLYNLRRFILDARWIEAHRNDGQWSK